MSCKNNCMSHKADYGKLLNVGDTVHFGVYRFCRVVGVSDKTVFLVRLSADSRPFGVVFSVPVDQVAVFDVGATVRFKVNGDFVLGVIRSYDCFGQAVIKVSPDYLIGNPIRVYHVPVHSLLAEVA